MSENPGRPKELWRPSETPAYMRPAIEQFKDMIRKDGLDLDKEWPSEEDVTLLVQLALDPTSLTKFSHSPIKDWFTSFYERRPGFMLAFMHHIRTKAFEMPPAQHWVNSPIHWNKTNDRGQLLTDGEIAREIEAITGQPVNARSVESARRKLRISQQE